MRFVTDQMGRQVEVPLKPIRIVSLVPSQTELLYYLGLEKEVVGQTLFCIHPKKMNETKPRVGGTKKLNINKIKALKPDLIIGNKEENLKEQIDELTSEFPVWMSDIKTIEDAYWMMQQVGELVGRNAEAGQLVSEIRVAFENIPKAHKSAIYLIWQKPFMAAGCDTYIHNLMQQIGIKNLVTITRYPELSVTEINKIDPELILLSSEPFPFGKKHIIELQPIFHNAKLMMVDGEMFSWYGSRMLLAAKYLNGLGI
ncbi:MAG: cobalamin-binding protein [Flavobacteriaceae bacterium]|nr:cobalamin-binding protein [Flavobacteriaceae bacterium]